MAFTSPGANEWIDFPDLNLSLFKNAGERQQLARIKDWGSRTDVAPDHKKGSVQGTTRVTEAYTVLSTDHNIFCDTDGGGFTVTLPAGIVGTHYKVMNTGTSSYNLTVAPSGTDLLVGDNSNFDLRDGESLDLVYETTEGWA